MILSTIKKRNDIIKAKQYTLYVYNKHFSIKYNKCSCNCLLIVNTKKNCKTSVGRNKLKRRIKEILRQTPFNASLVIYSKPLAFSENYNNIKNSIQGLVSIINKRVC